VGRERGKGSNGVFIGEYRHTVDEKGRIAVPVRFRAQFPEGAVVARWLDGCGAIHPPEEWDKVMARLDSLPISDRNARQTDRALSSRAFPLDMDKQGRFVVPQMVREWAGLTDEVVIVGARDHVELWEPSRWAEYIAATESPDALGELLQGLGI
jgi:MraZ protein